MIKFILKVLIFSAGLSILIKYGGPLLSIPPTATSALVGVITPSLILALALAWRISKGSSLENSPQKSHT